jgi:hypothetical protein
MKKIKIIVFAALVICLTPLYVQIARWPHDVPVYLSGMILVSGLVMMSWQSVQILQWTYDLTRPTLRWIKDGFGGVLIAISRVVRSFGELMADRLFSAGFKMRVHVRGGVS